MGFRDGIPYHYKYNYSNFELNYSKYVNELKP